MLKVRKPIQKSEKRSAELVTAVSLLLTHVAIAKVLFHLHHKSPAYMYRTLCSLHKRSSTNAKDKHDVMNCCCAEGLNKT